jgi:hypothetical protein
LRWKVTEVNGFDFTNRVGMHLVPGSKPHGPAVAPNRRAFDRLTILQGDLICFKRAGTESQREEDCCTAHKHPFWILEKIMRSEIGRFHRVSSYWPQHNAKIGA